MVTREGRFNTVCIIQPFDPRGEKIGGIESHMRELIRSAPTDIDIIFIGIDEVGDLKLREIQTVEFEGRRFQFFPLLSRTGVGHLVAAKKLTGSLTFQFFFAFFRDFFKLRKLLADRKCSIEIQRFEYATFGRLLGKPSVQIVHGEGDPRQPMDSILKKYWFLNQLNERISMHAATRIIAVNPRIVDSIGRRFSFAAGKTEFMSVSVNTDIFSLKPAFPQIEPFRIGFAGRLDAFKRPDLMFRIVDEIRRRGFEIEFHYIGGSDPERYKEFDLVRDCTVLHGTQKAEGVSELLGEVHVGFLVSEFEGMPVYALELLAVGRPLVVLGLPQMGALVENGVSGEMVTPVDEAHDVIAVANAIISIRAGILAGTYLPSAIRSKVQPYSHATQLQRLFQRHREVQGNPSRPDMLEATTSLNGK